MRTDGKLFKCIRYMLVAVLFTSACSTFADTVAYDLSDKLDVWDISGTYNADLMGCGITYNILQDAAGTITGAGDAICSIDEYDIDMSFTVTGTVTQKNNLATVKLTIKFSGLISDGWDEWKFKASEKATAIIDAISNTIDGTVKACVSGVGCETADFELILPDEMDGSAGLSMDVNSTDAKGTKLAGTGTLTLSNSDTYTFTVKGSYNAKNGLDKLTLTGVGKPSPGKFTLVIADSNGTLNSLKGKSLGQTLAAFDIHAE